MLSISHSAPVKRSMVLFSLTRFESATGDMVLCRADLEALVLSLRYSTSRLGMISVRPCIVRSLFCMAMSQFCIATFI